MVENTETSKWYVVHCHSGFEKKVADSILDEAKKVNLEDSISEVSVPTQAVVEVRRGVRVNSEKKFFPGYVLIKMIMNDDTWHLVRKTPNVMGFMGGTRNKPMPLSEDELNRITNRVEKTTEQPVFKTVFESGETVRINDGPFNDFSGTVEEVDYEKNLIRVSVSIFGKSTPVELNFSQVEKN